MAAPLRPMKAASSERLPTDDGRWAYEVKWDGMRVVTEIVDGHVTAWSANGTDATTRFPELQTLAPTLAGHQRVVLDGEVIAIDPDTGLPDFGRLQPRMQAGSPAAVARIAEDVAVSYVIFDVLDIDGHSLLDATYDERRSILEALIEPGPGWLVAGSE